jgi:hypothetical protein
MLSAYYGKGCDSKELFASLKIADVSGYEQHLNQYDVIYLDIQLILDWAKSLQNLISYLEKDVITDLRNAYGTMVNPDETSLSKAIEMIYDSKDYSGKGFIFIVDEWDCIFREAKGNKEAQKEYLDFLKGLLKGKRCVKLAYMTGILPIKKYGTHSTLNMFDEYSMIFPGGLGEFFGFTESEVRTLCEKYHMPFEEAKAWYDGYLLTQISDGEEKVLSMYNPNSMVRAMLHKKFATYWNNTETYEALKIYITMGFGGKMKEAVISMLSGSDVPIDASGFQNDMTSFSSLDDVLTLLVHLGYLTYAETGDLITAQGVVSIPNKEVSAEYITTLKRTDGWNEVIQALDSSRNLLRALWDMDETAVADGIDSAHESVSILQYNDENALSYTIGLAFYSAIEYYTILRECPTGKGYADVVYIPRKLYADKPAVVIELKYDKSADGALTQIKEKHYPSALKDYHGNLLLCGINYDKASKTHQCRIERMEVI